jgi:very-short-patch-repair endonuclease
MKFIPYNKELRDRARELRKNMTASERVLWYKVIKKLKIPIKRQKIIDNYIVDFYCSKALLVIEIDGDTHYTDDTIEYDTHRTAVLNSSGIEVIRFTNKDVATNIDNVAEEIINKIVERTEFKREELII